MSPGRRFLLAAVVAAFVGTDPGGASAQDPAPPRSWVDPPASPPSAPVPAPVDPPTPQKPAPPPVVEQRPSPALPIPRPEPPAAARPVPPRIDPGVAGPADGATPTAAMIDAARDFVLAYLAAWSSPNADAMAAMPAFYGRHVLFHGRTMSFDALMREKDRFVRRWPLRSYEARPGSLRATCDVQAATCRVSLIVDFSAEGGGRRSAGATTLDIGIETVEGRPVIATETSRVVERSRMADDD